MISVQVLSVQLTFRSSTFGLVYYASQHLCNEIMSWVGERDTKLLYAMSATTRCRKYCSSWHYLPKLLSIDKHVLAYDFVSLYKHLRTRTRFLELYDK